MEEEDRRAPTASEPVSGGPLASPPSPIAAGGGIGGRAFLEEYNAERLEERARMRQSIEQADTVPVRITDDIQVWLPTELSVVLRSLWEPVLASLEPARTTSLVAVWCEFMHVVASTGSAAASSNGPSIGDGEFAANATKNGHLEGTGAAQGAGSAATPGAEQEESLGGRGLTPAARRLLLRLAFDRIEAVLQGNNIHAVVSPRDPHYRSMLEVYYATALELRVVAVVEGRDAAYARVCAAAEAANAPPFRLHLPSDTVRAPHVLRRRPALLRMVQARRAGVFAVFGGQGVEWLGELRSLYRTYPQLGGLIERSLAQLRTLSLGARSLYNGQALDVMRLLQLEPGHPELPPADFLASAPVSYPMIGLTQLLQYYLCLHVWELTPADFLASLLGAAGHSQGVLSAVLIALSETLADLERSVRVAVDVLFIIGTRVQQHSAASAHAAPSIAQESVAQGWGVPTPMLAIFHMDFDRLLGYVKSVNMQVDRATAERQIEVSLKNGAAAFVVTGHPDSLHSLLAMLHRAETPRSAKLDQSRIPYSQRKREFSFRYLRVSAPFHHTRLLEGALLHILRDASALPHVVEWLDASKLRVPVYSAATGRDLRDSANLLGEVLYQQVAEPVDWPLATKAVSRELGVTHIVDFGPGEQSGIGAICLRNLEGAGVCVLYAGSLTATSDEMRPHSDFASIATEFAVADADELSTASAAVAAARSSVPSSPPSSPSSRSSSAPSIPSLSMASLMSSPSPPHPSSPRRSGPASALAAAGPAATLGGEGATAAPREFLSIGRAALFDASVERVPFAPFWAEEYQPLLVQRASDGRLFVDTRLSRLLDRPPLMVGGMTPTTVHPGLVSAVLNAGFHAELAGGGLPTESMVRSHVQQVLQQTEPGTGVTLNLLFLNPRLWGMQFPLLLQMSSAENIPIEGLTVAAGVPSPDRASEMLEQMRQAGMRHVSFKPGTLAAIYQVLDIARANPEVSVILQWTGGRGGGHHSFEDFHEPLLQSYADIRRCPNVVLVGGSGFGDADGSWPYISGQWSLAYSRPPMPLDGILIASRVMVAREAATAEAAKILICNTPGIADDSLWERSYDADAGGVVTVRSELGEPIHKIATRGLRLWADFDREFFSIPDRKKRAQQIAEKKDTIVRRLNADFQKVYFGKLRDGVAADVADMCYDEILLRMVELMFVPRRRGANSEAVGKDETAAPQQSPANEELFRGFNVVALEGRWIHRDYLLRVHEFARRIEERFTEAKEPFPLSSSKVPGIAQLESDPRAWLVRMFVDQFPRCRDRIICQEDSDYFLQLCRERGRKPVNFIPVVDGDLEFWFKKDSLWQSEDLDAVQDADVGRVVILQGPMSVHFSRTADEPVADILNGIHDGWVARLRAQQPADVPVPRVQCLGAALDGGAGSGRSDTGRGAAPSQRRYARSDDFCVRAVEDGAAEFLHAVFADGQLHVLQGAVARWDPDRLVRACIDGGFGFVVGGRVLSSVDETGWLEWLALPQSSWWRAFLTSAHFAYQAKRLPNSYGALFRPRPGLRVLLYLRGGAASVSALPVTPEVCAVDLYEEDSEAQGRPQLLVSVRRRADDALRFDLWMRHYVGGASPVSANFAFRYHPENSKTPVHEVTEDRNGVIKRFYAKLWFQGQSESELERIQTLSPLDAVFSCSELVDASKVHAFCGAIGRQVVLLPDERVAAPMDFGIVLAWEALIKPLFLRAIDGNLLQLVHLLNSFTRLSADADGYLFPSGSRTVSEMRVREVATVDAGERVTVGGQISIDGVPVLDLESQFLFRGARPFPLDHFRRFDDERAVSIPSAEALEVLRSKKWVQWTPAAQGLVQVGAALKARIRVLEVTNATTGKLSVTVRGIFVHSGGAGPAEAATSSGPVGVTEPTPRSGEVVVGRIEFVHKASEGNPVTAFLLRAGSAVHTVQVLPTGGYTMLASADLANAPADNDAYARSSGDLNPIHTNAPFAQLAGLPTTITHGMWTSALARRVVEEVAALGSSRRMLDYRCSFLGMVAPKGRLASQVRHVGMKDGNLVVEVATRSVEDDTVVLKGTGLIRAPVTAFVFTGQGSAEVGMGMELYRSSAVARNIWDRAERYMLNHYGVSLLSIVQHNPKRITVHFGGIRGAHIRDNYRRLSTYVKVGSEVRERRLFPQIEAASASFEFAHQEGLLFATQFSQPTLVLMELAAFSDLLQNGLVSPTSIFTGHSLGEYAALASAAGVLSVESLVDIVFLRGITMQNAVVRDEAGRSPYAMVAVNPTRVHRSLFTDGHLQKVIDSVVRVSGGLLLQIVNFNVVRTQYVVAGDRAALKALEVVLNGISRNFAQVEAVFTALTAKGDAQQLNARIDQLTSRAVAEVRQSHGTNSHEIVLSRGIATIPLPGIDVPFHSRFLADGVTAFREILRARLDRNAVVPAVLNGRYVPNVVATPFSTSKDFVRLVYDATGSEVLAPFLERYEDYAEQDVAYALLLELLSYQFASPVLWIETQHLFFTSMNVERMVEIGPAPTLATMARRTLESGLYSTLVHRDLLWIGRDRAAVYYLLQDDATMPLPSAPEQPAAAPASAPVPTPARVAAPVAVPAAVAPVGAPAIADAPVSALDFIQGLVCLRMKKPLEQIAASDSVKALSGGKSALQNEVVGDVEAEFGAKVPEGLADMPLEDVAKQVGASYAHPGKVSKNIVSKLFSGKFPGGFSPAAARQYLRDRYGIGDGRADGVFWVAATMEPPSRLTGESDAHGFLDRVAQVYSRRANVALGSGAGAATVAPTHAVPATASAAAAVAMVADAPPSPEMAVRLLVALKLKRSFEAVPAGATIKDLVGGKSALQNELVGDLGREFGGGEVEGAAEMELSALAAKFQGRYSKQGPVLSSLVNKLVAQKLPGGFPLSSVRAHFSSHHGLPEGRADMALAFGVLSEPAARLQSDAEVAQFLGACAQSYASAAGIALRGGGGDGGAPAAGVVYAADPALMRALEQRQEALVRAQMDACRRFLGDAAVSAERQLELETALRAEAETQLAQWLLEHGEVYERGVQPLFDHLKTRRFKSSWNWVKQDCMSLYYDYSLGEATRWSAKIRDRLYHIKNRATPEIVTICEYYVRKASIDGYPDIVKFISVLTETLRAVMDDAPLYRELSPLEAPSLQVEFTGKVVYREVLRRGVGDMVAYVKEMRRGLDVTVLHSRVRDLLSRRPLSPAAAAAAAAAASAAASGSVPSSPVPARTPAPTGDSTAAAEADPVVETQQLIRSLRESAAALDASPAAEAMLAAAARLELQAAGAERIPFLSVRTASATDPSQTAIDIGLTGKFLDVLQGAASVGFTLQGKTALVTGCGRGSIGVELLKGLLRAGAKVYATTSRIADSSAFFQAVFDNHGAKHSELIVLPFNQGSAQDVKALVNFIYESEGVDLDYVIPFAAVSEVGIDIGGIEGKSELSHRVMMTNVVRLVGEVMEKKRAKAITTRPAHVLLPLSPNHGMFGKDGLYAESKLGLEALLNKWGSEGWSTYVSVAGAVIGWTRGTGLMNQNNILAPGIEELGARTFSASEMCFNLMGLLHPDVVALAYRSPVLADLNGGLHLVRELNDVLERLRSGVFAESAIKKAVTQDAVLDVEVEKGRSPGVSERVLPRATVAVEFPELPSAERLRHVLGRAPPPTPDLDSTVVVAGFGEIGPYGNARTRWEIEAHGEFSVEGCIELAWMMGLIKYRAEGPDGGPCWVDTETGTVVRDHEVKARYEKMILEHTGVRIVEPALLDGFNPEKKQLLHQVAVEQDLPPLEVSPEEADRMRLMHGDKVSVRRSADGATTHVQLLKGSVIYIPKALRADRFVAGQVPSTWDPRVYGIPDDIIHQVDRVTLFTLVSTAEALMSAGVSDPYEFYQYVHLAEVGNTIGGGFGGMSSIRRIYKDRLLDLNVQGDALQESFINTTAAWVNMLLLSSSGPIITPVGACATAVESVDVGVSLIRSGRASVVFVGGYDDVGEESMNEFGSMRATVNNDHDSRAGRTPTEMSRPATSTRAGFVESHGAGVELLMSAALALRMGIPIYGVVAHVATATDKEGRSVPAPGQGILTTAREVPSTVPVRLLDGAYRARQLTRELERVAEWIEDERAQIQHSAAQLGDAAAGGVGRDAYQAEMLKQLEQEASVRRREARRYWTETCMLRHPHIAPLRAALAVWGLTPDDIGVASFHGTSTKANDFNESEVVQKQLEHLGRSRGNVIQTIFQKWLTGHPKGAAASWMMHGLIQSMLSGIVPGNRNADDIDEQLRQFDLLVYVNRSTQTYGFKAGLLKSFGFGQVGAEVLIVHPNYLLSHLSSVELETYEHRRTRRMRAANQLVQRAVTGMVPYVPIKSAPPYSAKTESACYLNPLARAQYDPRTRNYDFSAAARAGGGSGADRLRISTTSDAVVGAAQQPAAAASVTPRYNAAAPASAGMKRSISSTALTQLEITLREMGEGMRTRVDRGIGVDAQLITEVEVALHNSEWVQRNFTQAEINYCRYVSPDSGASFAGKFAAKEAVIKAISNADADVNTRNMWLGAGAPLIDIEVLAGASGAPTVRLLGHAADVARLLGVTSVRVAISHSGDYAVAQAQVQ